jgi:hypothetical protein
VSPADLERAWHQFDTDIGRRRSSDAAVKGAASNPASQAG